ncbi:ATP synthase subunit gamma, mitochondrial-like [Macrosteles quadrilineatus]|uniref:ATP synthase subunit gamma, mitochondrial-like n=1 Tax=Macrosteles quadrilineatus TaxID=74068 RepID=UPI0023E17541|nr:ATP synthase subunit gamma, mitochondrial-like [Macrosteles quadrilineatus]
MATLKLISSRLKSVSNIQKITKSMKMVSAAKFARAERELEGARPHGKGTQIFFERAQVSKSKEQTSTAAEKLVIAISSDRGLCGAVHTQISKAIKNELGTSPGKTKIVCIGDKMRALMQFAYKQNVILSANDIGRLPPNFLDASKTAMAILDLKLSFEEGKIYFNKFHNIASYKVSHIPLYTEAEIFSAPNAVAYDSLESDVLDSFLEFSFVSLLYYSLKENSCSEQASRMTAMDNATKNAGDMISKLRLTYNRTRQSVITKELIEIISGASALK